MFFSAYEPIHYTYESRYDARSNDLRAAIFSRHFLTATLDF